VSAARRIPGHASIPNGFDNGSALLIRPAAIMVGTTESTHPAARIHSTERQRADGSLPSGKSSKPSSAAAMAGM
jgi:hypothetical protein